MLLRLFSLACSLIVIALANSAMANECRDHMSASWATLVEAHVQTRPNPPLPEIMTGVPYETASKDLGTPLPDHLVPTFEELRSLCSDNNDAIADLFWLEADRAFRGRDYQKAIAMSENARAVRPAKYRHAASKIFLSHMMAGDGDTSRKALDILVDAHTKAAESSPDWRMVEQFSAHNFIISAYEMPESEGRFAFLAKHESKVAFETVQFKPTRWPGASGPKLDNKRRYCGGSSGILTPYDDRAHGSTYEDAKRDILEHYRLFALEPEKQLPRFREFCHFDESLLPAMAPYPAFTGGEYRDPSTPPTENELLRALKGDDPKVRSAATDYFVENPASIPPIESTAAIIDLWFRGDRQRAVFWFYIWQTRTRPWAEAGSEYAQVRGAMNYTLRREFLTWSQSDSEANKELWIRAIRYEKKIPLYAGRPSGKSPEEWDKLVKKSSENGSEEALLALLAEIDPEQVKEERKKNGLYVGPWIDPGSPLKDEWR